MVVKTNRGVYMVASVDIICEKRVTFNGKVLRLVQEANNIADASALKINLNMSELRFPHIYGEDSIFVGNLANAVLQETVDSLAQSGYADLTKWTYQKERENPDKCVFDDGTSIPYICIGSIGMAHPFVPAFGNAAQAPHIGAVDMSDEDISDDFDDEEESGE